MMAMVSSGRYCGRKMLRQGCFTLRAYCATNENCFKHTASHGKHIKAVNHRKQTLDKQATNDRTCRHCSICRPVETRKMGDDFFELECIMWGNLAGELDVVKLEAHVLRAAHLHAQPGY